MPLNYDETTPFDIPAASFNADGLASPIIQGARYGGAWVVNLPEPMVGGLSTEPDARLLNDDRYPLLALETVFIWLNDVTKRRGWRVVAWDIIPRHGDERPYFIAAQAVIANETFVPQEGAVYADQRSLDSLMGYRS